MLGETAQFDVFISYRVQSDAKHAELIYDKLTAAGLKVWWDKKSLIPGVPWQVIRNIITVTRIIYILLVVIIYEFISRFLSILLWFLGGFL